MLTRRAVTPLAVAALAAVGVPLGAGTAEAEERRTRPAIGCLWAGTTYAPGQTVVAGGAEFRCGERDGAPYWFSGQRTDRANTVPNPGAAANPTGRFSAGARQPGTSYTDYCVGSQLVPGTDDIYQVQRLPEGLLLWKPVAPATEWAFAGDRPAPTWRTQSLCIDGVLT
ncbi:hypothetical protein [Nocardia yamanashiensis]|uniref:hypothetical protein n=1 Tax=Nocardia yamanashiensis TaxID=209247 RepID=UPI00083370B8|nr:hypothetical protein [Nocardia yamanashiensis]